MHSTRAYAASANFCQNPQNPLQSIQEASNHDYAGHFFVYKSSDPDETYNSLINCARSSDTLAAAAKLPSPFKCLDHPWISSTEYSQLRESRYTLSDNPPKWQ